MKQENDILANDQLSIYLNPAREQVYFIIRKTKEKYELNCLISLGEG